VTARLSAVQSEYSGGAAAAEVFEPWRWARYLDRLPSAIGPPEELDGNGRRSGLFAAMARKSVALRREGTGFENGDFGAMTAKELEL
jgi:hypothetical protein